MHREVLMLANDEVLKVLKFELDFLGKGGYRRSLLTPWRAPLVFEDSPTCAAYYREQGAQPCSECPLIELVPPELKGKTSPCRYIPLNARGDTLDAFYHWAYEPEIEDALRGWLLSTIQRLEQNRENNGGLGTGGGCGSLQERV